MFTGIGGFELGIQNAYREKNGRSQEDTQRYDEKGEGLVSSQGERISPQSGQCGKQSDGDAIDGAICVGFSEVDKHAIETYLKHFPEHKNFGDATKINPDELPDFDMLCGGFPCFSAGTLILTFSGYKPIEEVTVGDLVLTHKGRWRPVTGVMQRDANETLSIRGQGFNLITTPEHPFYARKQRTVWWNEKRTYRRQYSEPSWESAGSLTNKHRTSSILPPTIKDEHGCDFWWIVGRYLADGWRVQRKWGIKNGKKYTRKNNGRVVICCNKTELRHLKGRIERVFSASVVEERTVYKFHITNAEFYRFLEQFGKGAGGKHIPGKYLGLEQQKANALFEGYLSGDGCKQKWGRQATTISERLAYGLLLLFQRTTGRVGSLSFTKLPEKCVIENRVCNQHNGFSIRFPNINRSGFIEGDYAWKLIRYIEKRAGCRVYNISVKEDESYTANNCIVHNCQSFSIAGKRAGFQDTRGTLFHEILRIAKAKRPRLLLLENVKGLLSADNGRCFATIISSLDELGYNCEWQILNSKHFGVPQNRERVFIIGHLRGTTSKQVFPLRQGSAEFDKASERTRGEGERVFDYTANTISQRDYKGGNQLVLQK